MGVRRLTRGMRGYAAKKGKSALKKYGKKIARKGLYGSARVLTAKTRNPGFMWGAKKIDQALISRRNRNSGGVTASPTGSKVV